MYVNKMLILSNSVDSLYKLSIRLHSFNYTVSVGPCFTYDAKCVPKQWDLQSVRRLQHRRYPC